MARLPITINIHFNKCVVNTPVAVSVSVIVFHRMLIWHKEMLLFVEEMEIMAELTFCGNFFTKNMTQISDFRIYFKIKIISWTGLFSPCVLSLSTPKRV